uniref:Uncharacterized protein n=1 Tax=Anguilla anguilla TaxID=7936 RepID=A0A0E9VUX2_ANGAN
MLAVLFKITPEGILFC